MRGSTDSKASTDSSLGLGLYIVQEIARAHGGLVDARAGDGETVFTVSLPRSPVPIVP
jgi:signal transduction histidine kinase